jgi:hypothetical protein
VIVFKKSDSLVVNLADLFFASRDDPELDSILFKLLKHKRFSKFVNWAET